MAQGNFEKRKKGVELVFKCLFWLNLISALIFVLLMIFGEQAVLLYPVIVFGIAAVLMFFAAKLAHSGHIAAGIIGIIVGLFEFSGGSILSTIIGILLLIDSILYLVNYKK